MPVSISSPVLIPISTLISAALGVLLLDLLDAKPRLLAWVSLASMAVAPALALIIIFSDQGGLIQGMLSGDGPGALWTLLFCGIGGAVILLEWQRIEAWEGESYALVLFAVSGALVVAQSTHMLPLTIGLATLYVSVDGLSHPETAWPDLLVHTVGLAFLAFGMALLYGSTSTLHLDRMADGLQHQLVSGGLNPLSILGSGLLIGGLIVPLGIQLLSKWSPETHRIAQRPEELVAILLPGAAVVALGRLAVIWPAHLDIILAIPGVWLAATGTIAALRARAIVAALHGIAIAQAGLVLTVPQGPMSAPAWGLMLYLFAGSSASLVGLWALATHIHFGAGQSKPGRSRPLSSVTGLGRQHPWIAAAMTLCLLNLAGAPPLAVGIGHWHLYYSIIENGHHWLIWFMIGNAAGMWLLVARWLAAIWRNPPQEPEKADADPEIVILVLVCVVGVLLSGFYAETILNWLIRLAT